MKADLFRQLAALGLDTEQIAGVLEIMESEAEDRKEKGRARWRKWKENNPTNVSKRLPTTANVSSQLARVEDNSSKKDISGEEKKSGAPAALSPRQELEKVLDSERAAAVVEHRQRLKKPLTAYAARKLATSLSKDPDANAAADRMIARGWTGFEPHWGVEQPRATAPPKPLTQGESIRNMAREKGIIDATGSPIRHLETSDRDGENPGVGDIIRLAVAGNNGW